MDSSRTPLSPGSNKRRRVSPSAELPMGQTQQQQTSLPSIRQLHPYLPSMTPDPSYNYSPPPSHYPAHLGQVDMGASHSMGAGPLRGAEAGDHEADDVDQRGPPKKKRRRQALSCTECKRRKIKCDRTQPCTPCTRRGEEAGCQWHIVEPVDFCHLPLHCSILPNGPPTTYARGCRRGSAAVRLWSVEFYGVSLPNATSTSTSAPAAGIFSTHGDIVPSNKSPFKAGSNAVSDTSYPFFTNGCSYTSLPRHRPENSPISAAATVKASPLSLASITSPYHPDQSQQGQSKNFHAQTLILGERLRPGSEDPTSTSGQTQ
ncbi:hypothetical protein CPB84DRAFT_1827649, partial [Gymnopilus junonius]